MEGEQFISINPDTLNDSSWSYRDLQKVAKSVGVRANLKRSELIESLQQWHRLRIDAKNVFSEDEKTENIDMNVVGSNFSLLAVKVRATSNATSMKRKATPKRKRKSIVGLGSDDSGVVSPTALRPLREESGTPGRSCLKSPLAKLRRIPIGDGGESSITKLPNICFSPFNGVKIIAHRDEEECRSDEEEDDNDVYYNEEENDEGDEDF